MYGIRPTLVSDRRRLSACRSTPRHADRSRRPQLGWLLIGFSVCGWVVAGESKHATTKADAWIGKDAGELLLQLRVDGGRVDINENDATGETSYTWSSWNPAWTEEVVTGGGLSYGGPSGAGSQMVGVTPGGNGVAGAPIFRAPTQSHYVDHPATHRCDVTFYADMDGIVTRWEYTGSACARDIKRPNE